MKKSMTVLCSVILLISLTACEKDYRQEIAQQYQTMESYTAKVLLSINDAEYQILQSYQAPDAYRSEVLSPDNLAGTVSLVTKEEVTLSGGVGETVTLPRKVQESMDYLHLADFFEAYYQEEEPLFEETDDEKILLTRTDLGKNPYRAKQVLYLNKKDSMPEKMQVFGKDGNLVFQMTFLEFEFTKE